MLPQRIKTKSDKADKGKRSPAHRAWVRGHHCSVPDCHEMPIECAHVRRANNAGMGFKPSDGITLALCREHHSESHRGEQTFERKYNIDLMAMAHEFYLKSPHRNKLDNPYG